MPKPKNTMKGVSSTIKNGSEYWYARIDGQKKYCGKGDKGREIAIAAKAKEISKAYENKEVGAGLKVKRVEFKTVNDLSNWYMKLPSIQDMKVYTCKLSNVKPLLLYFGKRRVNDVEADDMETYRELRLKQGRMNGTVDNEIKLLSSMYHLAVKRKKIPTSAMPGEFIILAEKNPRRIITDDEFESLLSHASPDFYDVLVCGYETGMRLQEICSLTASQVHLDIQHFSGEILDYIDLGIFDTKNGTRRTIPVSERLKEVLQRRLKDIADEDYVFTDGQARFISTKVTRWMESLCEKAEIPYGDKLLNKKGERIGVVFHCLRHTRTTRWVEEGFSDEIIRRATGHKSLEAYRNYVKVGPAAVMRLVKNSKTDKNGIKSSLSTVK
jgi:integrase